MLAREYEIANSRNREYYTKKRDDRQTCVKYIFLYCFPVESPEEDIREMTLVYIPLDYEINILEYTMGISNRSLYSRGYRSYKNGCKTCTHMKCLDERNMWS